MLSKLKIILIMPFVYPVIFFSSLHVLKSNYGLKYALFQIWSRWLLKRAKTRVEIQHAELIPLENDYVFVSSHPSAFDPLILAAVLPVDTHFVLHQKDKFPFIHVYAKRLNIMRMSQLNTASNLLKIEKYLSESSVCIFQENQGKTDGLEAFYAAAIDKHWTLIPIDIKNSQGILKIQTYHKVLVEVKTPLYYEEYQGKNADELASLLNERILLL